ncbi:MAG: VWA domain-containing protein [Archangium sp.]|nr:VWA domain-containing protein [Archangium sp.]MDP3155428.1 VWA domain-containing protein [Archangium sp.]MDP3573760.1 VWA domain-containing protein [Archangium sp.]
MSRLLPIALLLISGCDPVGRENGRGSAVPEVAPPILSPVEIKPPRIERAPVGRVDLIDPPRVDSIQVDELRQSDGVVDILWVVDDSGSMTNERRTLVGNFNRFVQELLALQVDFQMGVTSIVASDGGRLRGATKIITNLTTDPRRVFELNTTFPSSRSRWEQGLRMTQLGLSSPNIDPGQPNAGFLRPNAALAIIVLTNEDDSSFGTTDHYARVFKALKGKGNENLVSFSVIGGTIPNGCVPPGETGLYGSTADPAIRYAEVATKTGGIIGSICDASFEQTLVRIAQALNTLKRVFPLTLPPIINSITVTVAGVAVRQDPVNGWQYRTDTNSVVFLGNYVPPPGSTVRLQYAYARP